MRAALPLFIALMTLGACEPPADDTAVEDLGPEPAASVMLASARWVWQSSASEQWYTYQRAIIPLVFSADAATRADGPRSEHCRVMGSWDDQEQGLSPLQLETSLLSVTASWDDGGHYDYEGLEGEDPYDVDGDSLTLTADGVEASVAASGDLSPSDALGAEAGFDTPVYAQGYDLIWSWITGSETVGSIYCVVEAGELAEGELGPEGIAVPEDGQQLWEEQGFASEELYVGLATSTLVEGVFTEPTRLMAGRVFKMEPE